MKDMNDYFGDAALTHKQDELIDYLIFQLQLYADFARERNYLWKEHLVKIFQQDFVFNQISNSHLSNGKDSALA